METERPYRTRRRVSSSTETKAKKGSDLRVILTQIFICIGIFLLALIIKIMGGNTYTELRDGYNTIFGQEFNFQKTMAAFQEMTGTQFSFSQFWDNLTHGASSSDAASQVVSDSSSGAASDTSSAAGSKASSAAGDSSASVSGSSREALESGAGGEANIVENVILPDNVSLAALKLDRQAVKPVEGKMTSFFGLRDHPITSKSDFHTGVDFAAAEGTPIVTAFEGTVKKADYSEEIGNYIVLDHGKNLETRYYHCLKRLVKVGETVKAGQKIAELGNTGTYSTGPHLHFEIEYNGKKYNPEWALNP